jgi:isocitrate lyase
VRDQNTQKALQKKRLMTLMQVFLIHRYSANSVHYVTPTEDNEGHATRMKALGIFSWVHTEIGQIIVANVNKECVAELVKPDRTNLLEMINKTPALV